MFTTLSRYPLVAVFFHPDAEYSLRLMQACYEGGMRLVEFTNRGPEAPAVFTQLRQFSQQHYPGLLLGIGTIYKAEEAELFIDLGADFVVQPVTVPEVGVVCKRHNIPWIPGAMTPTEIFRALELGAEAVKVFPGVALKPAFIKAVRGPMPNVPLMVNGGIEPDEASVREWFEAGVNGLGMGALQFFEDREMQDFNSVREKVTALMTVAQKR
ncbi:MAG: bifunctional 4-hydroxy-2-oxoglutarate aldolase/2-dehydro-3-deoxy-phosphogluconate aldolase [Saprospiraceae bacterium]|nr:bifunctional 4-hydroxy-2-oxoglutarate aldolase/2-dehydro-3-deoxy-phosphogluconate aldolase [Saprospiraceae bacterium]